MHRTVFYAPDKQHIIPISRIIKTGLCPATSAKTQAPNFILTRHPELHLCCAFSDFIQSAEVQRDREGVLTCFSDMLVGRMIPTACLRAFIQPAAFLTDEDPVAATSAVACWRGTASSSSCMWDLSAIVFKLQVANHVLASLLAFNPV